MACLVCVYIIHSMGAVQHVSGLNVGIHPPAQLITLTLTLTLTLTPVALL
jgi:hypothetical protein